MNNEIAHEAKSFVEGVLLRINSELDKEAVRDVNIYLTHGEYEMAFEGLFIEIMNLGIAPDIDWHKSGEIAKKLKLDEESIFDYNFWARFSKYVEEKKHGDISK
jgi:hypothetical protein